LVDQAQAFEGVAGGGGGGEDNAGGGGVSGKLKAESKAAAGSLADLRAQISRLKSEIESAPNESAVLKPLIDQLTAAEKALESLEAKIAEIKNPTIDGPPSLEDTNNAFGGLAPASPRDLKAAELEAIIEFNDLIEEDELLTIDAITLAKLGANEEIDKSQDRKTEKEKQRLQEIKDLELSAAGSISDAIFQIQEQQLAQRTEQQLAALDSEYAAKIQAAEGNNREQERLQKELNRKKEAIELEAAKKRKSLAIKQAIIEGALAVLKALQSSPFAAIAAGVAAAAQIAIISRQQFARGGYTGKGYGARDSSGFKPAGIVHEGEYVAPKWQVDDPTTAPVIRWLENRRLRGYAAGGLVTSSTNPTNIASPAVNATATLNNLDVFTSAAMMFANAVATMPTEVKARVAYTDIETTGDTLNRVRSDAST
jgi:hypothetical protein